MNDTIVRIILAAIIAMSLQFFFPDTDKEVIILTPVIQNGQIIGD